MGHLPAALQKHKLKRGTARAKQMGTKRKKSKKGKPAFLKKKGK